MNDSWFQHESPWKVKLDQFYINISIEFVLMDLTNSDILMIKIRISHVYMSLDFTFIYSNMILGSGFEIQIWF